MKKLVEKKESRREERKEAKMPPGRMARMERMEGKHYGKGGMVKKAGRGC